MEVRIRNRRVPDRLFPSGEVRIWLGDPANQKERRALERVRESLKAVGRAGDWDILRAVADGDLTPEQVHVALSRRGIGQYREGLEPESAVPTIREAFKEFLPTIANPTTRQVYSSVSGVVMRILGSDTPMTQVSDHDVDQALQTLAGDYSAGYRSKIMTVGSSLYTWWLRKERGEARKEGRSPIMTAHPFRQAKSIPTPTTRHRFLSREEYADLLLACEPPMRAMYATCVWAGLRVGEFRHLRPQDMEIPQRIRIQPQTNWSPKGYPKSERGVRDIPIHQAELLPLLEVHAERYAGGDRFFVNPRTGRQWTYFAWAKQVRGDVQRAGMVYGAKQEAGITTHTFRHTLGSWMAQRDVQMLKIARILGNTVEVASRHYTHLLPEDLDDTIQSL